MTHGGWYAVKQNLNSNSTRYKMFELQTLILDHRIE